MSTSLDSCDDRHAYVGDIFQNLYAFVVNLAPNAGIGGIAERGPIDISNELPTSAREDYDLVRSILTNPVEGIDKFRVRMRRHNERPAVAVELGDQYAFRVARQLQITIVGEVVTLMRLHSIFLSIFLFHFGSVFCTINWAICPTSKCENSEKKGQTKFHFPILRHHQFDVQLHEPRPLT